MFASAASPLLRALGARATTRSHSSLGLRHLHAHTGAVTASERRYTADGSSALWYDSIHPLSRRRTPAAFLCFRAMDNPARPVVSSNTQDTLQGSLAARINLRSRDPSEQVSVLHAQPRCTAARAKHASLQPIGPFPCPTKQQPGRLICLLDAAEALEHSAASDCVTYLLNASASRQLSRQSRVDDSTLSLLRGETRPQP